MGATSSDRREPDRDAGGDRLREMLFLRALIEHIPDRIYFKDLQSRFIFGNMSLAQFHGLEDPASLYGRTDFDFFSEQHAREALEDEREIIRTGQPKQNMVERETWPGGRITWSSTSKAPFFDEQGKVLGTIGISHDITEQRLILEALQESEARYKAVSEELETANRNLAAANQALQELSLTDPLTGLRNRRFLTSCMPEDIANVERLHRDLALGRPGRSNLNVDVLFLMVDLDHFKVVNDRYGHLAGDRVLQQVGRILLGAVRGSDTVVRFGGEEFLVVARGTDRAEARILPERIREAVEAHPFDIGEEDPIRCTCSVGFCLYPLLLEKTDLYSWEQVVELADHCLYAAKQDGRNAWAGLAPGMRTLKGRSLRDLPSSLPELIASGLIPMIKKASDPSAP